MAVATSGGVTAGGGGPGQNTIYIRGLASTTPNLTTAGVAGLACVGGGEWAINTVQSVADMAPTAAKFSVAYVLSYLWAGSTRHLYWDASVGEGRWFLDNNTDPSTALAFTTSSDATPPPDLLAGRRWLQHSTLRARAQHPRRPPPARARLRAAAPGTRRAAANRATRRRVRC